MANPNFKQDINSPESKAKKLETRKKRLESIPPSPKERVFAEAYVATRSITEAAKTAGLSNPETHGCIYIKRPRVAKYIKALVAEVEKKELARASKQIVNERSTAKVDRSGVLTRLWELANMSPDFTNRTINGQVKAADSLAEILGMKIKQIRDVTRTFEGWTDDELEHFAATGNLPERFRSPSGS